MSEAANCMGYKQKLYGGLLGTIGFLLSPLSWWNDLFINFPIAYIGACLVSLFYRNAFLGAFVSFYWVTNVLGFMLLQKGLEKTFKGNKESNRYSLKDFLRDVLLSLAYTLLIIILVKLGIVKPVIAYTWFSGH
jgi:hypothetical protein